MRRRKCLREGNKELREGVDGLYAKTSLRPCARARARESPRARRRGIARDIASTRHRDRAKHYPAQGKTKFLACISIISRTAFFDSQFALFHARRELFKSVCPSLKIGINDDDDDDENLNGIQPTPSFARSLARDNRRFPSPWILFIYPALPFILLPFIRSVAEVLFIWPAVIAAARRRDTWASEGEVREASLGLLRGLIQLECRSVAG